ncbi:matrix [Vesiculovirus malpais]|uniref:Matrix protein n=1 Tax=Vesiculovirus malpais TaxID=1972570 RepID=M4VS08_9RHAB|nr:matrix [Vesiculovirus malpais]AGI04016.1 matrix [Vesiculovirus malpais]
MKSIKKVLGKKKEKGEKKSKKYDLPPNYNDLIGPSAPSAPMFGLDPSDYFEQINSNDSVVIKLKYSCEVQVRAIRPFSGVLEAADAIARWEMDYRGFLGKKPFYRLLMGIAIKKLRAAPSSLTEGNRPEYNCLFEGHGAIRHNLGQLPPMSYVSETFTRDWQTDKNKGSVHVKFWLGMLDTNDEMPEILSSKSFQSESELKQIMEMMGIRVKKSKDNKWEILSTC